MGNSWGEPEGFAGSRNRAMEELEEIRPRGMIMIILTLITSRGGIHSGETPPAELWGAQHEKDMEELEQVQRKLMRGIAVRKG